MSAPLEQHQIEIQQNQRAWERKPLLRAIYAGFYERIGRHIRSEVPGRVVEIGSGIGNLKATFPEAIATDLFPNTWLDLVCDGYELPFRPGTVSHLILFDVFHHLEVPRAFLRESGRVLAPGGRIIIFDPYVSLCSYGAYEWGHHEKTNLRRPINQATELARPRSYYTGQGNATRLFFRGECQGWLAGWQVVSYEAFAAFSYLGSGGFSKPACYPESWLETLRKVDRFLSRWPRVFGGRCLITLERAQSISVP